MTYDEKLVERIRTIVPPSPNVEERKMFGGIAFLVDGKMFVGVDKTDLMVRVGPTEYAAALARAHVRPMDFTGRPLTGYVYVSARGTRTDDAIAEWVRKALEFVVALPAKPKPKPKPKPRTKAKTKTRPKTKTKRG
ncbi:MAG: TfoX/Sxy family protein [Kofleriaceae bacterium]